MKRHAYPFAAIVGQGTLKKALLLAAVDWRLGVLLRGDKGAGKTTAARALAELLPESGRFVNLPVGVTEDRLLGGIDLAKTLQGQPQLRPGLVSEANGGVLYVDEVNLLPDHLADTLLDAAATAVHTVEREGFSLAEESRFVLMGSMNPEEGSLRPQLLDRFALVVDVGAPQEIEDRREVVERRLTYDADPDIFGNRWAVEQNRLRIQIVEAREMMSEVELSRDTLGYISRAVHERGVRSMRADLAVARAACAHAALLRNRSVSEKDVEEVLPLAVAHRFQPHRPPSRPPLPPQGSSNTEDSKTENPGGESTAWQRRFEPASVDSPELRWRAEHGSGQARGAQKASAPGPVIGTRRSEEPTELDLRPSILDALALTGTTRLGAEHLHEKRREPQGRSRYLFLVDSSGSHAAGQRMSIVKGAAVGLIEKSVHRRDEVAVVSFRGASSEVLVQPTRDTKAVAAALEYLPTGGRTPLAHALDRAKEFVDERTLVVLLTDGRANVPLWTDDPWADALRAASEIRCRVLVVDTELAFNAMGRARELAASIHADSISLEDFGKGFDFVSLLERSRGSGSNGVVL
jgi:magnesium chelatase subunit D